MGVTGRRPVTCAALALAIFAGAGACTTRSTSPGPEASTAETREAARVASLRSFERELRARLDARPLPSSETTLGADPWAIRALEKPSGRARYVGILRGRAAIVLLDDALGEIARAPAPRSPTGLALLRDGRIAVAGELSGDVAFFAVEHDALVRRGELHLAAEGLRDVVAGPEGALAVLDPRGARVFWAAKEKVTALPTCRGAVQLTRTEHALVTTCVIDHALEVVPVVGGAPDVARKAVLRNDGPFFGVAAREEGDVLTIAAGGVEDHPLDRREGSFGFIDSFVHVFRVPLAGGAPERTTSIDVSEHAIVTPKALAFDGAELRVAGYGTSDVVSLTLSDGRERARRNAPPGMRAFELDGGRIVAADPLLDAWVILDGDRTHVVPVPDSAPPRAWESRVGEALVFTTLIAPWNKSEGRLSRFTCETCHFEGTVDGRTHHTGRGEVHATTKPIMGLYNNRPYFSRALDPDLAVLSMNEFRAANAKSEHDPFFAVAPAEAPWLEAYGVPANVTLTGEDLRRAFITFLAEFTHRPNAHALATRAFSPEEQRGAAVFRDRCESCHEAKLAADATTRVPFADWERSILGDEASAIVFGDARYEKTGIEPTVHERGARVTSLRRIWAKRPYFTNGSAPDLDAVLERARFGDGTFFHDKAPPTVTGALAPDERAALRAFLELL